MLKQILEKIVAHPAVYNLVQRLAGRDENYRRLKPYLHRAAGDLLLDIGGGTGEINRILDATTRYAWLGNDPQKLQGVTRNHDTSLAVVGDVTRIPFAKASVHTALCVAVSHHLSDGELRDMIAGVAKVCRKQFIFLDALEEKSSTVSNLMWRYDRGANPRRPERLLELLREHFVIEDEQRYRIFHHYLLCIGTPKEAA